MTERIDIVVSERGSRTVRRNLNEVGRSAGGAARQLTNLRNALGVLGVGLAVRRVLQLSEAFAQLRNSLLAANVATTDLVRTTDQLLAIANRTRAPVSETATLYSRLTLAAEDLGASQNQLLAFTELTGQALAVQGSTAGTAAGALLQLSQALGGSVIQAQEFNSLIDGARPLLQAVADGSDRFGGSISRLREEVRSGTVTSKEFFEAALAGSESVSDAFENTTATLGQQFTVLNNSLTVFIGTLDELSGATASVGGIVGGFNQIILDLTDSLRASGDVFTFFRNQITQAALVAAVLFNKLALELALFVQKVARSVADLASLIPGGGGILDFIIPEDSVNDQQARYDRSLERLKEFLDSRQKAIEAADTGRASGANPDPIAPIIEIDGGQIDNTFGPFRDAIESFSVEISDFAQQWEDAFVNAFKASEDALVDFVTTGELSFSGLVDQIEKDLARLAVRAFVTQPILNAVGGLIGAQTGVNGSGQAQASGASSFSGLLGSIGGSFFGAAANGMDFQVPNSGGRGSDRTRVSFDAMPGEFVSVRRPDQMGQGGSQQTINQTNVFQMPGGSEDDFKRSQGQIAARVGASTQRAAGRNR